MYLWVLHTQVIVVIVIAIFKILILNCCTFIHGGLPVLGLLLNITDIVRFSKLGLQCRDIFILSALNLKVVNDSNTVQKTQECIR